MRDFRVFSFVILCVLSNQTVCENCSLQYVARGPAPPAESVILRAPYDIPTPHVRYQQEGKSPGRGRTIQRRSCQRPRCRSAKHMRHDHCD
jgi:hypothetical protein